mmetsp:Transcript_8288/g.12484  ORF Transcript_8288/g.12484 Transcript_8288/m.12484 type:complete len:140 (+) Transcript_8288:89-508(+)
MNSNTVMTSTIVRLPYFILLIALVAVPRSICGFGITPSTLHCGISRSRADVVVLQISSSPGGGRESSPNAREEIDNDQSRNVTNETFSENQGALVQKPTELGEDNKQAKDKIKLLLLLLTICHFSSQLLNHSGLLQNYL